MKKGEPLFSVVCIMRNEATVLPRLLKSLEDFKSRGGEFCALDTGSTDDSVKIVKDWGGKVKEVGDKYVHYITEKEAKDINDRFVVENEAPIVVIGDRYFDFASARNEANEMTSNKFCCTVDCDEVLTVFDIDKINEIIESDTTISNLEYQFVFSHMQDGSELIKFIQSKFFDKERMFWQNVVHEMVTMKPGKSGRQFFLGEEIFKLEHWQNPITNRGQYLKGLAIDCFNNPDKDRQSHYFFRECWWVGRPFSAAKGFISHVNMNAWPAERAESMLFLSDICGAMGGMRKEEDVKNPATAIKSKNNLDMNIINSSLSSEELLQRQLYWAHRALDTDPTRREPLIKLAQIYMRRGEWIPTNLYATASLEIPWSGFYGSNKRFYENEPHEILYRAKGWIGDIEGAKKHLLKCLEYQREDPVYLRDTQYYFDYAANNIPGWMSFEEQLFLFETAKRVENFIELGSWKGKSTHAICSSGCKDVTAIDTWEGSQFEPEAHAEARSGSVFEEFKNNLKDFPNLKIIKKDINDAVKDIPDKSVDVIFIDCGHSYEEVLNDIKKWKPKARLMLCGHDYCSGWSGVERAVNEELGGPDKVVGTIWVKNLV